MSDLDKIDESLDRIFHKEGAWVVCWNETRANVRKERSR
jgi:hypothetical protein